MMFECCPTMQIYALITPLVIYALKTRTEISKYLGFYETKLEEKMEK